MGSTVSGKNAESYLFNWVVYVSVPQSMCYSHYGNGVGNGAISTAQWGLLSNGYKLNPVGQWGKILVIVMGFVDTLGQYIYVCTHLSNKFTVKKFQAAQLTHIKDFWP